MTSLTIMNHRSWASLPEMICWKQTYFAGTYVINKLNDESVRELALRIRALKASKEEIASFVELVKREGGIAHAEQVMYEYRNRALQLLPASADEALRLSLTAYIDYVIERKK